MHDPERTIEFEFVRATENAALNAMRFIGKGDKNAADAAACDAIQGVFDLIDIRGEVVIGEGIKDKAPGIFLGDRLGKWSAKAPRFNIALDPVDGTTNLSKGSPNAISVMAAAEVPVNGSPSVMRNIPSYYSHKIAYGPAVAQALSKKDSQANFLDAPLEETLERIAKILEKRVGELVVLVLDRPRNQPFIESIRRAGASLRTIADGDITAAVAPSLPDSGIDLYVGIGGSPEGVLTATAVRALGGDIQLRMWFPNPEAKAREVHGVSEKEIQTLFRSADIVTGESAIFCATGIIESPLLPGVKLIGHKAITHSILMRARSRTVRYIRAVHDLEHKTIHLRSTSRERSV